MSPEKKLNLSIVMLNYYFRVLPTDTIQDVLKTKLKFLKRKQDDNQTRQYRPA